MDKITEKESHYRDLELKETMQMLQEINTEDQKVALAVREILPAISNLVDAAADLMLDGGRIFYIGSGTSGRLGVVDASECPPTFGVPDGMVVGLIAGGDKAIRKAQEFAEDDGDRAWLDLQEHAVDQKDIVIGIAASGTTPYVIGGMQKAQEKGILTACITCNPGSPVTEHADHPLVAVVGPEYVTGSTRMKSGTAQKLILNMISTAVMIKIGRVQGNRMVDMQLSNKKLVDRGAKMVMSATGLTYEKARELLLEKGSVRKAIQSNL